MRFLDIDFDNISSDKQSYEKSYKNILICDFSYKTFMGAKPLGIRFNNIDAAQNIWDEL